MQSACICHRWDRGEETPGPRDTAPLAAPINGTSGGKQWLPESCGRPVCAVGFARTGCGECPDGGGSRRQLCRTSFCATDHNKPELLCGASRPPGRRPDRDRAAENRLCKPEPIAFPGNDLLMQSVSVKPRTSLSMQNRGEF